MGENFLEPSLDSGDSLRAIVFRRHITDHDFEVVWYIPARQRVMRIILWGMQPYRIFLLWCGSSSLGGFL